MARILFLFVLTALPQWSYSDTKNIICELEGNYSITYEDFRRNYFNEAVEIAKKRCRNNHSITFLFKPRQTERK